MRRPVLSAFALVSALAVPFIAYAWVASYGQVFGVRSGLGRVVVAAGPAGLTFQPGHADNWDFFRAGARSRVAVLGFEFMSGTDVISGPYTIAAVPYWFVLAVAALPAAAWLYLSRRHQRRAASHLCAGCSYDLRATPERCPECGTATPAAKSRGTTGARA